MRTSVWICFFECLFIAIFKVVVGLTGGSKAMLGSALYSLTDLLSAFLLLVGLNVSRRPADSGHPYGHGKIEHIISLVIGFIVLAGTVALTVFSTFSVYRIDMQALPHWIAVWASVACICLSHIVYRLVLCAGKHGNSPALMSHARHMRLDTLSGFAVIAAILLTEVGFHRADALIAIAESVHIFHECAKMLHKSINNLMDVAPDKNLIRSVRNILSQNPAVIGVGDVKGKHSGRGISFDIELLLDGNETIEECDKTVRALEKTLKRKVPETRDVYIHYHPRLGDANPNRS